MTVKEKSEKVGLKLNIQKAKIMASGPIILWQIDGEMMETVTDYFFWGPKYKVSHCFHCFPIYLPSNDGTRHYDLSFLM